LGYAVDGGAAPVVATKDEAGGICCAGNGGDDGGVSAEAVEAEVGGVALGGFVRGNGVEVGRGRWMDSLSCHNPCSRARWFGSLDS
jgi:hypothetical protein